MVSLRRPWHRFYNKLRVVSCLSPFCPRQSAAVEPDTDAAPATAAESTLPVESMKDSGSLELVPSVSVALPAAERAATMPAEPIGAQTVLQEGTLGRKHDVEGSGKKSSNRSVQSRPVTALVPSGALLLASL